MAEAGHVSCVGRTRRGGGGPRGEAGPARDDVRGRARVKDTIGTGGTRADEAGCSTKVAEGCMGDMHEGETAGHALCAFRCRRGREAGGKQRDAAACRQQAA